MTNWNNPTTGSNYTDFPTEVKDRDEDCAKMFRDGTGSNIPTNAIRLNPDIDGSGNFGFQKWTGSAWNNVLSEFRTKTGTNYITLKQGNVFASQNLQSPTLTITSTSTLTGNVGVGKSPTDFQLDVDGTCAATVIRPALGTSNGIIFPKINTLSSEQAKIQYYAESGLNSKLKISVTGTGDNDDIELSAPGGIFLSNDTTVTGTLTATTISGALSGSGANLTNLNGSQITTGTVAGTRIGNINASKVTAGVFTTGRIPDLGAGKITSGTFNLDRIPGIPASKFTGTDPFATSLIPNLDASKITSGNLTNNRLPTTITRNIDCVNCEASKMLIQPNEIVNDAELIIGEANVGNRRSLINFIADDTYDTYALRIVREDDGANSASEIKHRGSGALRLEAEDASSDIRLKVNTKEQVIVTNTEVTIQDDLELTVGTLGNTGERRIKVNETTGDGGTAILGIRKHSSRTHPTGFVRLGQGDTDLTNLWFDTSAKLRSSGNNDYIGSTSGTVIGTQTSDARLKNLGDTITDGLNLVKGLDPIRFTYKTEPDVPRLGFSAQQVKPIVPEAVYDTNEVIAEGEPTKLAMYYTELVPVLVAAIKELSAEVDALKAAQG